MLNTKINQQRVFVVGDGQLFSDCVEQIVTSEPDLVVSHAIYSNEPGFSNIIKTIQPDVILVCESGTRDIVPIRALVPPKSIAIELLIVIVRLRNNKIDIYARPILAAKKSMYRHEQIISRSLNDLVSTLRKKPHEQ